MAAQRERDVRRRLDAWLPEPVIRTRHARSARVEPEQLWDTAQALRLADTPRLGRLVRWRIPGLASDLTFAGLFAAYPFTVLEEGERCSISGLCGSIWTLSRDYPRLEGAEEFRSWEKRGTVRVLFAHWVDEDGKGGARLMSEARVQPVDRVAGLRLRAVWAVVGPFERLVGAEPLTLAARRAERAAG